MQAGTQSLDEDDNGLPKGPAQIRQENLAAPIMVFRVIHCTPYKKAILSPLGIVWQTSSCLEAVICPVPLSSLTGLLAIAGHVKMPVLEWEGVSPTRKLGEFVSVSQT